MGLDYRNTGFPQGHRVKITTAEGNTYASNTGTYGEDVTSTSYTISSSSSYTEMSAAGAFDNGAGLWGNGTNVADGWVAIDFGEGKTKRITKITLRGNVDGGWDGVKDFKFQASNATSNTWASPVDLLTQTGHPENELTYTYTFPNSNDYRYYRLLAQTGHDGNWTSIEELEMMESISTITELYILAISNSSSSNVNVSIGGVPVKAPKNNTITYNIPLGPIDGFNIDSAGHNSEVSVVYVELNKN